MKWLKNLTHELEKHPLVDNVNAWHDRFAVRYKTGIAEKFWFDDDPSPFSFAITRKDAKISELVRVYYQYENDLDNPDQFRHLIEIPFRIYQKCNVIEKSLLIQTFLTTFLFNNYNELQPLQVLQADLDRLRRLDYARSLRKGIIDFTYGSPKPGRKIIGHFFDLAKAPNQRQKPLTEISKHPQIIYNIIRHYLSKHYSVNVSKIIRGCSRRGFGPVIPNPLGFAALFKQLKIQGPVLDLDPGVGSKAIACARLGLEYQTWPNEYFDRALELGFGDFIQLNHKRRNDETGSIIIGDDGFNEPNIKRVLKYANQARYIVTFVPRIYYELLKVEYNPTAVIKVKLGHKKGPNNGYFFIW